MESWINDLRYGLRTLAKSLGFTLVALLTLGLGIGANAAIFSVVQGVLLRPLPYQEPERLVRVFHAHAEQGVMDGSFSPQDFDDLRRELLRDDGAWERLGAWFFVPGHSTMTLTGQGEPRRLEAAMVSADFFPILGVQAARGRTLLPEENVSGRDRAVVLSHRFWRRAFAADPRIVGGALRLEGERFTVAGVMPPSFQFPAREVDLWAPISLIGEDDIPHLRGLRWMQVAGRLRPGATLASAGAQTDALLGRLAIAYPDTNEGWGAARLLPLQEALVGDVRPALVVLLAAVAGVLLIACANLANLLLARAATRGRELAVRAALGAGRRRLLRQLLTESVLLALAGGVLGLFLAVWGVDALVALAAGELPRPDEVTPDARVVAFTFAVSLLTGLAFGLLPALRASRPDLQGGLKEGGRGGSEGRGRSAARNGLVVAETALAVVLLVAAGLMLRSFWSLVHVDPGFRAENVLSLSLTFPEYPEPAQLAAARDEVIRRVGELPAVIAAGASKTLPLEGGGEPYGFTVPGRAGALAEVQPQAGTFIVSPGYFRALGIPLLAGRIFTARDDDGERPVVVVNRAFSRQLWGGEEAVGKTLLLGEIPLEVVGVVGDVRSGGLAAEPGSAVYIPQSLAPRSDMKLFLRTAADPLALAGAVREAIWGFDRDLPISDVAALPQVVAEDVARPRFLTILLGLFGALALTLAAVGLYGVVAYGVGQRTHEIGIRMALGARRGQVLAGVVAQGMSWTLLGLALGLAGAFAASRLLAGLLFGVAPTDALTFAGVAVVLAAAALLASWLPARRAASIDPLTALRSE
ncbi:MAG TPA: ABC transporter permease [Thermoanaerobaculia bacterium]|nr:ABC transporter permease [Thermoanaerobaculia bacterium]